ncbi:fibrinogen beta chain-like [Plectropomus leopardus]|uniref:fibrinogen beta chain-like n=1 Tax=Plectropomus leopardus TaxID=160734 RepID=UPI001C4D60AB|nr:fibrinogen beta chain-like [Plectropomus leopardus]
MRTLLLLCVFVAVAWAQDNLEYDDYDSATKSPPAQGATAKPVDARGHRPTTSGWDRYNPNRYSPPPISGGNRYRGRPTTVTGGHQVQEKEVQPEAGGCTHASEEMVGRLQHAVANGPNR